METNVREVKSHAEHTKRIARNTLMLYMRMLFSMLVSLYTSRVVLNTLGVEDYGIYNVVGGFVAMFSIISRSLSASASRFLTFELGRADLQRLKDTFSTTLLIHVLLAGIIFIFAETIGVWFLNSQMTIPPERLCAANWVFQASVISFMFGLCSVPYNASITSHERMKAFAYIGIVDVVMRLLIVLFIAYSSFRFDRLVVYSLLLVAVSIMLQGIYIVYCHRNFEECRLCFRYNKKSWKEMSAFAGWNFIGSSAALLKDQGVDLLLNLFIGPVINAARGIAGSVCMAVGNFAGNFMAAVNPQITKSYASGDRDYMFSLVERCARFSFYIMLTLALPILFETDFILTLWLKQYPSHTANFVRLVLILSLCDVLSYTLITLQLATGRIRNYQLAVGGMLLMNFPLSYICLKLGALPESTYVVAIFVAVSCLLLRLIFLRKMVGLSVKRFLWNVCLNVSLVTGASVILPLLLKHCLVENSWEQFIVITLVCITCSTVSVCMIGCSKSERLFIWQKMRVSWNKLMTR